MEKRRYTVEELGGLSERGRGMISVLMLTYNRENLICRAVESILAQTYKDFEFIIVDNGSSDKSGKIADEYAKNDNRIRVIHRDRGSISAGRNTALDAASGDYIAFVDDDDWVESDYLEFLFKLIIENNADISICGATGKVFDDKRVMTAEEALIELMWRKKYTVGFPAKMFKKDVLGDMRFPEDVCYDDIALMYKLIARVNTAVYHGLLKYNVCRHENNNSAWTTNHSLLDAKTLDEYLCSYRVRTEWLSERFPNSAAAFRYFEWSFMISMVEKINRLNLAGCDDQLQLMLEKLSKHREEFLSAPEILDFEKDWVYQYIK